MLSIIVPVYNGEKYLERCIKSLLNTTIKDKEIIIVNDGSSDHSLDIALKYQEQYSNLVVITQDNAGVSVARNTGLKFAHGKFITFVDCDDWVKEDIYEHAISRMNKENVDMFQFNHVVTNRYNLMENFEEGELLLKDRIFMQLYADKNSITPSVWDKVFRKELLVKEKFFSKYKYGEDIVFLYSVLSKCGSIIVSSRVGYYYFMHTESATQDIKKISLKKVQDSLETLEIAFEFSQKDELLIKKIEKRIFEGITAWNQFICRNIFRRQKEKNCIRDYILEITCKYKAEFLKNPYLNKYWKIGIFLTSEHCNILTFFVGLRAIVKKLYKC